VRIKFSIPFILCLYLIPAPRLALAQSKSFESLRGDMSTYYPYKQEFPTSGDTIKVGVFFSFSGPGTLVGQIYLAVVGWAVHDINSQGGIWVDGKLKKIQLVKGDNQSRPSVAKRVMERLCLVDKVDFIIGTNMSNLGLIGQQVAAKYKRIYVNIAAFDDSLMNEVNFNRYTFRLIPPTTVCAKTLAHFYAQRPEQKFYILCQDYLYGHTFGSAFKRELFRQRPDARIVGEDYHPKYARDYAPYLEKVRESGAEVIITGDWPPDSDNLIIQSRQLGLNIPLAGIHIGSPNPLKAIGGPAGAGIVVSFSFDMSIDEAKAFRELWNGQWMKWKESPYNTLLFKWPGGYLGHYIISAYWLFDVISEAGSTGPERIIEAFEESEYRSFGHTFTMRACDHQAIMDMYPVQFAFPNQWFDESAGPGRSTKVSSNLVMQPIPVGLDRCSDSPYQTDEEISAEVLTSQTERLRPGASFYLSQAIHGFTYGMLLFLVASGLTIVLGMMGVLNFAHAHFFMLGAYICYQVVASTGNFWLALLIAPITVAMLGIVLERYLLRVVRGRRLALLSQLLLTLGVALVIAESVKYLWGTDNLVVTIPESLNGVVTLSGLSLPVSRLFVVALSLFILSVMVAILFKTRLGAIVRAAVSDSEMVSALGIDMPGISTLVFAIGTWMAGVAGVALTLNHVISPGMAEVMMLESFVVVVVGGFGSLAGALLVSIIMGELNSFGITFIPRLAPVLVFAFMAIVLAIRPMGFFGERK